MLEQRPQNCPECVGTEESLDRRHFMKSVGLGAALAGLASTAPSLQAQTPAPAPAARVNRAAEDLIQELYANMSAEQKTRLVLPWDHRQTPTASLTRQRMFNSRLPDRPSIGAGYTPAQQELNSRILAAISSGEQGLRQLTRNGTYDNSGSLGNCGAYIFGEPGEGRPYAWVFMGHHLTVRCDANSEPNAAFGGPMYYGHSADGNSQRNVFNYQTRAVMEVYDALSEAQRRTAVLGGNPGEQEPSVTFRRPGQAMPGLAGTELSDDQKTLVQRVLRTILSPYRREDADEVMDIVRRNGGMDRIHLAFYREGNGAGANFHFWRLEGPGFVWNYRVLPHVHTFVNIRGIA